jgi:legumain
MMARFNRFLLSLLYLAQLSSIHAIRGKFEEFLSLPSEEEGFPGEKWALLIAGSSGYYNYRHQVLILKFI